MSNQLLLKTALEILVKNNKKKENIQLSSILMDQIATKLKLSSVNYNKARMTIRNALRTKDFQRSIVLEYKEKDGKIWSSLDGNMSFRQYRVDGDGNCLFRSFARGLYSNEDYYAIIPEEIVSYVDQNWNDLQQILMMTDEENQFTQKKDYIDYMIQDTKYGTDFEILCFVKRYNVSVKLHDIHNEKIREVYCFRNETNNDNETPCIHLLFFGEDRRSGHFDFLVVSEGATIKNNLLLTTTDKIQEKLIKTKDKTKNNNYSITQTADNTNSLTQTTNTNHSSPKLTCQEEDNIEEKLNETKKTTNNNVNIMNTTEKSKNKEANLEKKEIINNNTSIYDLNAGNSNAMDCGQDNIEEKLNETKKTINNNVNLINTTEKSKNEQTNLEKKEIINNDTSIYDFKEDDLNEMDCNPDVFSSDDDDDDEDDSDKDDDVDEDDVNQDDTDKDDDVHKDDTNSEDKKAKDSNSNRKKKNARRDFNVHISEIPVPNEMWFNPLTPSGTYAVPQMH